MTASLAKKSEIPPHVPAELVYDFDFYRDAAGAEDLHGWVASVVEHAPPIFFTPRNGGHWVIARYEALFRASQRTDLFSNHQMAIPFDFVQRESIPLGMDPPEHGVYRAVLARPFSPKAIGQLEGNIRALANKLIDQVIDKGECEFIKSVSEPLPVMIFMDMMGLPLDQLAQFRTWVTDFLGHPERRAVAYDAIDAAIVALIEARQKERKNDLVSILLEGKVKGRSLTMDELRDFCHLLVIAGLDTVVNGIAYGVCHLARDQELQARLRAEPALIPDAVEEFLRRYTFTSPGRTVAHDMEFDGVTMRKGEHVLLLLAAAGLDSSAFADPKKIDLGRQDNVHMAFNTGPHRCLGSHLARAELRILYEEWLRRVPAFRLNGPVRYHGGQVFGINELHLTWR